MNKKKQFFINNSGSTAVEFSLIALALIGVIFCTMEAGRIFWTQNAIQYAVETASRLALVDETLSEAEIESAARNSLEEMFIDSGTFSVLVTNMVDDEMTFVEVDATYQYSALFTVILPESLNNFELKAYTRRPLVWESE